MANIKVFARLKPCQNINQELIRYEDEAICIQSRREVTSHSISSGSSNLPESIRFRFAHVFGTDSSQNNVFDVAAKDIVKGFMEGYNGTIFAYGQTGAGKTYTIQGEIESVTSSNKKGIILQSLSMIFDHISQVEHETISIHVSFMEIYKEMAFDLLGFIQGKDTGKAKQVLVTMAGDGVCHLHGISHHHVQSFDEAAGLYQLGMASCKTAETPDNKRLSRSHTVFSIKMLRQRPGEEIFLRSKLILVDLAGSEQVGKSGSDRRQHSESKHSNLSLHHLETVIIALQRFRMRCMRKKQTGKCLCRSSSAIMQQTRDAALIPKPALSAKLKSASAFELGKGSVSSHSSDCDQTHVPYENSLLTMLLQDSLGGNCNTAMIAALSLDEENLPETIATCRVAQRVARILNKPVRNEEIDKNMVIRRLQTTLAKLHLELAHYKKQNKLLFLPLDHQNSLNDEEDCVVVMQAFLAGRIRDPVSHGIDTPTKFRTSLRYLRRVLGEVRMQCLDDKDSGVRTGSEPASPLTSEGENDGHLVSSFIEKLPFPVGDLSQHRESITTQESGISFTTEHEGPTTDGEEYSSPDYPYRTPQRPGPENGQPCTQTSLHKIRERRKLHQRDAPVGTDQPVEQKDVTIAELELERETLWDKSKTFTSRLMDQRARLVMMSRQGNPPEELENEKIAEFQLEKKKRDVESKLSSVIKKLADLKHTERARQLSQPNQCHQVPANTVEKLKLKEQCTRQKLLSRREQMKSLVFSSCTQSHQRVPSTASFCSGSVYDSSLSRPSSTTLPKPESDIRYLCRTPPGSSISSTSSSHCRVLRGKPTASSRAPSCCSHQTWRMPSCSQSSLSKRGDSSKRLSLSRDVKCRTLENASKACPLVQYMSNSHRALYHKSTFPRRIDSDGFCSLRGTKRIQRTESKKQVKPPNNEPNVSRSSSSVPLELDRHVANLSEKDRVITLPPDETVPERVSVALDHSDHNDEEDKLTNLENFHQVGSGQATGNKAGEEPNFTSVILLKSREEKKRRMEIRKFFNAAEVIQRTWRTHKRKKKGEKS